MHSTKARLFVAISIFPVIYLISLVLRDSKPIEAAHPIASIDSVVTIDEAEKDTEVVRSVKMGNLGHTDLIVTNFRSSCSCSGLFEQRMSGLVRVDDIVIKPNEIKEVFAKISVNWRPDLTNNLNISYNTNDPTHETGNIQFVFKRIYSGIFTKPSAIYAGRILKGESHVLSIDVYDQSLKASRSGKFRKIAKIQFDPPSDIAAEVVNSDSMIVNRGSVSGEIALGNISLIFGTNTIQHYSGHLLIYLDQDQIVPTKIPIDYSVVGEISARPNKILLPRRSGNSLVTASKITLRSYDDSHFEVASVLSPNFLEYKIENNNSSMVVLQFNLRSEFQAKSTFDIVVKCRYRDRDVTVNIPFVYSP